MVTRDIIQRLLAIINDTRGRLNTLESREVALLTATQTLTNKTLTTPTIGNFTNAQHAHTGATSGGTISHGSLTDLTTGDPHTQYLLESTYDANTILKADADNTPVALTVGASTIVGRAATGDIAALSASQVATIVQGSIDHGSVSGLADDDHTQYALLAGRSGGQSLSGGTAANDDLTLQGTTNATRTTSYVILQPNGGNVGIGTASPGTRLSLDNATIATAAFSINRTNNTSGYANIRFDTGGSAKFSIGMDKDLTPSADKFTIYDGSVANTVMTITGGNVGIGTTSPGTKLSLDNATIATAAFSINRTNNTSGYANIRFDTGGSAKFSIGMDKDLTPSADKFTIYDGSVANTVMTITGGNVGIGTTSPGRKLHVAGSIVVDGDEGGIAGAITFTDVSDTAVRSTGVGTIKFDDATDRTNSGFIKIYVGTTTYYVPIFAAI